MLSSGVKPDTEYQLGLDDVGGALTVWDGREDGFEEEGRRLPTSSMLLLNHLRPYSQSVL